MYVDDRIIYHAGDLNWWHWEEESEYYNEQMRMDYQKEIHKLKNIRIDVAFVPLDPRQEEQYYWGLDYSEALQIQNWSFLSICGDTVKFMRNL